MWIVNHYAAGPGDAAGTRHYDLALQLMRHGADVTIFASSFDHVTGSERLRRLQLRRRQRVDGVRFVWLRTVPYRGNSIRRQMNMLSFLIMFLVAQGAERRPDTVIGSTVHPFAAFGAWIAARLRGARFIFEIRDLWPQTLVDLGALKVGSPGERLLRWMEAWLVRRAARVISLLPGISTYLRSQGLPIGHVVHIPNGARLEARRSSKPDAVIPTAETEILHVIASMHREGRVVFGYVGAMGTANCLASVVDAAARAEVEDPGVVGVVLVGDGPDQAALTNSSRNLPNVAVMRPVPKRSVPTVLAALDAGIVSTLPTPVYRYGISFNKLFEYMAAGLPVVFGCQTDYDPVASANAGLTATPNDPEALARAFLALARRSPPERAHLGQNGRRYVSEAHALDRLGDRLFELVR